MRDQLRTIAIRQRDLVDNLCRLAPPVSKRPDKWHEDKSDLAREAMSIVSDIEGLIDSLIRPSNKAG